MRNRGFYARLHKGRGCGEDQIAAQFYGVFNQLLGIVLCGIFIAHRVQLIRKRLFQIEPAQLVSVGPRGSTGGFFVDKRGLQLRGT